MNDAQLRQGLCKQVAGADSPVLRQITQTTKPTKPVDPQVSIEDGQGNEFICHLSQLNDPENASEEELTQCVDSGYAACDPGN
jgi:hypothetical protein